MHVGKEGRLYDPDQHGTLHKRSAAAPKGGHAFLGCDAGESVHHTFVVAALFDW